MTNDSARPKVSIFGIGYVGAVTSACISEAGFDVTAVDVDADKVYFFAQGISPIIEHGLQELLQSNVAAGRLKATTDVSAAVMDTDVSIVCVGTPSKRNGSLDLSYVARVAEEIGAVIGQKQGYHSVVMRSTMLPGSMDSLVIPVLESASGKKAGVDFGVAYYPEFLRESTAIEDYDNPAVTVLGKLDERTIDRLRAINAKLSAPEFIVDIKTAEAVKYANNCWHATKITFANEIGNICHAAGVDGQLVMEALCADHRLNISPAYMRPGMAFGGSCLPKDLRALLYKARAMDVETPLLTAVEVSNAAQLDRAMHLITSVGKRKVGMLGLSFKAGTDDLRESPNVEIAERLHGKGFKVQIYDRNVHVSALRGSNLSYVRTHLPHLAELLSEDIEEVCNDADIIVIGNGDATFRDLVASKNLTKPIIDLVRVESTLRTSESYMGLCW